MNAIMRLGIDGKKGNIVQKKTKRIIPVVTLGLL
jgi:hypothetical protein